MQRVKWKTLGIGKGKLQVQGMVTLNRKHDKIKKNSYEAAAWDANTLVCGIDEVGRGCLAGPLVTAAAILHPGKKHPLLRDSKELEAEELLKAYAWLSKNSWFGIGIVSARVIDTHNIWQATLIAMKKALVQLLAVSPQKPSIILVDAMPLNLNDTGYHEIDVHHFPKGENKSISIAAASIIAKVRRDALMARFEPVFPGYRFGQHKGYGTKMHQAAIADAKPCLIHRTTFLNGLAECSELGEYEEQQTIF